MTESLQKDLLRGTEAERRKPNSTGHRWELVVEWDIVPISSV